MTFAVFTGSVVFKVSKWIAVFLPTTKKGLCGVWCVCVCVCDVCVWAAVAAVEEEGRGRNVSAFVDVTWFPSLRYTAKCVCLGKGKTKETSVYSSGLVTHVVRISQRGEKISLAGVKFNFFFGGDLLICLIFHLLLHIFYVLKHNSGNNL